MTGWEFAAQVAVGLVVIGIAAAASWSWRRRNRLQRLPAAIPAARQRRLAARSAQAHQKLVDEVLERAEVTGTPVPRDVERTGDFVTATYWPGRTCSYYVADHAIYERKLRRGYLPPQRTFVGQGPRPVRRWTDDELKAWLDEHPRPEAPA